MKLSELSTDRALDVMCELTPYVSSIIEDDEILAALNNVMPAPSDGGDADRSRLDGIKMIGGMVKITPLLLKTHRPDVYGILSVVYEKTVDEISAQPITDTIQQVRGVFQDSDLLSFFKSSAQQAG